jgi:phosphatidylserine/phosphatidylglycerophosphate/cardiolipin synthase-like enzyme
VISTESGAALSVFLDIVTTRPEHFTEVVFCAPFIDVLTAQRLSVLTVEARRTRCGVTIITAPEGFRSLSQVFSRTKNFGLPKISVRPELHAKAYLAVGRGYRGPSEAMITSANLTAAAFSRNFELGVRATSKSAHGRALLAQIRYSLSLLSN